MIWYLNNNVRIGSADGPMLWPGWSVAGVADFNSTGIQIALSNKDEALTFGI